MIITVISFIGLSVNDLNYSVGCNTKLNGLMGVFNYIDDYLIRADMYLCSSLCPCYIKSNKAFISDIFIYPIYEKWIVTNNTNAAVNFQSCPRKLNLTNSENNLVTVYSQIEKNFKCVGFCKTTYNNNITNNNMTMYKYLFSDINK